MAHIGFHYLDECPDIIIEKMLSDIEGDNLEIRVTKYHKIVYGAIEWTIPTIFTAYILKTYFDVFLKEICKDHYHKLNTWLKKTITTSRLVKVHTIASSLSPDKIDKSYHQSKSISLVIQIPSGKFIKVLFDDNLDNQEWEDALDALMKYVYDHYNNERDDYLASCLTNIDLSTNKDIFAIIDQKTQKWVFYDTKMMIKNGK